MEQKNPSEFAPPAIGIAFLSGLLLYCTIRFLMYTTLQHEEIHESIAELREKLELSLSSQEDILQDLRILEERISKTSTQLKED